LYSVTSSPKSTLGKSGDHPTLFLPSPWATANVSQSLILDRPVSPPAVRFSLNKVRRPSPVEFYCMWVKTIFPPIPFVVFRCNSLNYLPHSSLQVVDFGGSKKSSVLLLLTHLFQSFDGRTPAFPGRLSVPFADVSLPE